MRHDKSGPVVPERSAPADDVTMDADELKKGAHEGKQDADQTEKDDEEGNKDADNDAEEGKQAGASGQLKFYDAPGRLVRRILPVSVSPFRQ